MFTLPGAVGDLDTWEQRTILLWVPTVHLRKTGYRGSTFKAVPCMGNKETLSQRLVASFGSNTDMSPVLV